MFEFFNIVIFETGYLVEMQLLDLKLKSPNLKEFTIHADHKGAGSFVGYSNPERVKGSLCPILEAVITCLVTLLLNSSPVLRS